VLRSSTRAPAGVPGAGGGWGDRLPDGIADVGPSGVGEPVEVEVVVPGDGEALAQAAHEEPAIHCSPSAVRVRWAA
jgi:hypothetical protein